MVVGTRGFGTEEDIFLKYRDKVALLKYDLEGNLLDQRVWSVENLWAEATASCMDDAGNVYVVGDIHPFGGGGEPFIVKFNNELDQVWAREVSVPSEANLFNAVTDASGDLFAVGYVGEAGLRDGLIVKLSAAGELLNALTVDAGFDEVLGGSIVLGPDGAILITGSRLVLKTGSSLSLLSAHSVGDPVSSIRLTRGTIYAAGTLRMDSDANGIIIIYDNSLQPLFGRLWDARSGFRLLGLDQTGNNYVAGGAFSSAGSWRDYLPQGTTIADAVGSAVSILLETIEGAEQPVEGIAGSPEAIIDQGGGGPDVLVIKNLS